MSYIDGFVAAVPTAKKEAFREHANFFAKIFKDHGAIRTVECWGDDVPEGKITSFPMAVKCGEDETVIFSWIEWPDKAARDACHAALEADPELTDSTMDMPFDMSRVIMGSFKPLVDV